EGTQVRRSPLHEGAAHLPVLKGDAPLAPIGAQQQQPRFAGQADDLQDVPEAKILEASDEAHPPSGRSSPTREMTPQPGVPSQERFRRSCTEPRGRFPGPETAP